MSQHNESITSTTFTQFLKRLNSEQGFGAKPHLSIAAHLWKISPLLCSSYNVKVVLHHLTITLGGDRAIR